MRVQACQACFGLALQHGKSKVSPNSILAIQVGLLSFCFFFSSQCAYQETFLCSDWRPEQDQQVEKLLFLNS